MKTNKKSRTWGVVDIENQRNGTLIAIGSAGQGDTNPTYHSDWGSWLEYANDRHINRWFAHNGGNWDYLSLLDWLDAYATNIEPSGIVVGGRLISLSIPVNDGFSIELADSFCIFHSKLDDIARVFTGRGKEETDGRMAWDLWENDRQLFWRYLGRDVMALRESLKGFTKIYEQVGGEIKDLPPLTISSAAMGLWKSAYGGDSVDFAQEDNVKLISRQAYHGGRVELFNAGVHEDVKVFDVNSLYPYVMRNNNFPTSGSIKRVNRFDKHNLAGIYAINVLSRSPGINVFQETMFPQDNIVACGPEIARALAVGYRLEVKEGIVFTKTAPIFRDYVDKLYSLRLVNPGKTPINEVCKRLMNHLYGKFGEKEDGECIKKIVDHAWFANPENNGKATPIGMSDVWFTVKTHHLVRHSFPAIAALVTSYARAYLHSLMPSGTIYCDTDSIHVAGKTLPTGNGLGKLKLESVGKGIYIGRKLYMIQPYQLGSAPILKAKGIGRNTDNQLTLEQFQWLSDNPGKTIRAEYRTAATLREALGRKMAPCSIPLVMNRHRRIRRIPDQSNPIR